MIFSWVQITGDTGRKVATIESDDPQAAITYLQIQKGLSASDVRGGFTMPTTSIVVLKNTTPRPDISIITIDSSRVSYSVSQGTTIGKVKPGKIICKRTGKIIELFFTVDLYIDSAVPLIIYFNGIFDVITYVSSHVNEGGSWCEALYSGSEETITLQTTQTVFTKQKVSVSVKGYLN